MRVLFGSKNHKAVDVIIERLRKTLSSPAILKCGRFGQISDEVDLMEELLSAVDRALSYEDHDIDHEINKWSQALERNHKQKHAAQQSLLHLLDCRNRISTLDSELESLGKHLSAATPVSIDPYQYIEVDPRFCKKFKVLARLINQKERWSHYMSRIRATLGFDFDKRILKITRELQKLIPIEVTGVPLETIQNCQGFFRDLPYFQTVARNPKRTTCVYCRKRVCRIDRYLAAKPYQD